MWPCKRPHFSCQCGHRGALEKPPGTLPWGACLLLSLPGRRGCGRWWAGSWVQGHGSRELFSSSNVLFYFLHPRPWLVHVSRPAHHAEGPHRGCCYNGVFMGLGFQHGASWRVGMEGGRRLSGVSRCPWGVGRWELA